MFAEFQGYIMEAEAQLNTILRVAMGGEDTAAEHEAEAAKSLPSLFRRKTVAEYADDRTRDFIKWLLTQVESLEGSQIELKDLVERASKASFSEKFVRGTREDVFEESAWIKGARCITGLRWISI
jgi:hypothetical protein